MEKEEEEIMDFHSMKRKQLQALCKSHGVLANLSNREMADRLCSILKENKEPVSRGKALLKNSSNKVNEKDFKVVKKVRFSPENQTIIYEVSGRKRAGRRRITIKSLSKKQTQATENEVSSPPVGRRRARSQKKNETLEVNLKSRRQLSSREVLVGNSNGDLTAPVKNVKQRGSEMARKQVSEDNVIVGEDAKLKKLKACGRITRSRAHFVDKASESEEFQGQCLKFPPREEHCKCVGRNALGKSAVPQRGRAGKESLSMDAAVPDRVLRHSRRNFTKEEGYEVLYGNSGKVKGCTRITRSQTKNAGSASAAESENEEEIVQQKGPGRARKSVRFQRSDAWNEGLKEKKDTRKRSRNVDLEGASELEAVIEPRKEFETVKNVVIPSVPLRRTRRNKSNSPNYEQLETGQTVGQKDANLATKYPRRSSRNVVDVSEVDRVLLQKEQNVTKDVESAILRGNARKFKRIGRITRSRAKTAGRASELESEAEEETLQLRKPSTDLGKYVPRRKSAVLEKSTMENDKIRGKKETRRLSDNRLSDNTDLGGATEREELVEPTKEFDTIKNVSILTGTSGRTRRNTVMFKSATSIDRMLETHQIVGREDDCLVKHHSRRSSRNASRNQSIVNSSEVGGISHDVAKVRPQKRRRQQAQDEDTSVSKFKTLAGKPPKRSARNASKSNLVELVGLAGKFSGKKHYSSSRMPVMMQEAPSSDNLSALEDPIIEDTRLVAAEPGSDKNILDTGCWVDPQSTNKKRKASQMKVREKKKLGSVQVSSDNFDMVKVKSMAVLEDECSSVADYKFKPVLHDAFEVDKDGKSFCSLNKIGDFGNSNPIEQAVVEIKYNGGNVILSEMKSPDVHLSPVNQQSDLAEPSNIMDLDKVLEAKEPLAGKNINNGSYNADDQSNNGDTASVQECQNIVLLGHAEETSAEPIIKEAVLEGHQNEHSGSSSDKKSEFPRHKVEEINVFNSYDEGNCYCENLFQPIEMQESTAQSLLVISETGTKRTAGIQLNSDGGNVTEATPCKHGLENEDLASFDKVNHSTANAPIASNDAMEDNANCFRGEELPGKGIGFSDEIICRGETSACNAGNGICVLAKTIEGVTTSENKLQEFSHNERASQVGDNSINDGYEENLLAGGSSVSVLKTDGEDDRKKEHEVIARYSPDAIEEGNEVSEKSSGNVSKEIRGRCMHEISDTKETSLIIMEESVTDEIQQALVASSNLKSPGTVDEGSFPYDLALLKSNDQRGKVSSISTKSSSYKGKESVHNGMQEKLKVEPNEDAKDDLNAEVQAEVLPQYALEGLQDGVEHDRRDATSTPGKVLIQQIGDCDFVKRTVMHVSDDGSCGKVSLLDKSDLASGSELVVEKIHEHADLVGNSTVDIVVEQSVDIVKEEKSECDTKVDLGGRNDQDEVASLVNGSASTCLTELISKDCEVPDNKEAEIMINPAESVGGVGNFVGQDFKAEDRNSDGKLIHVGTLAQSINNHSSEGEAAKRHDGSARGIGTVSEVKTFTVATKRAEPLNEADKGEALVGISPMISEETFKSEFVDISDPALCFLSEIISANAKDLELRPNEHVSNVSHVDEPKFGDLDNYKEENVLELERIASVTWDNLISVNTRASEKKENVEKIDRDSNFKDSCSGTRSNKDDNLVEVGLCNDSATIEFAADDAGEISMNENVCSKNIEDGTKGVEEPTLSQTIRSERKLDQKNSVEVKFFAETCFGRPEICSSTDTVPHLGVLPFPDVDYISCIGSDATDMGSNFEMDDQAEKKTRYQKDNENSNGSMEGNARTDNKNLDNHKDALLETASIDDIASKEPSCSNRQKSISKVAEEGIPLEKLFDVVVTADTENSASSSIPRMTADCSAFLPLFAYSNHGIPGNKHFELHIDSPCITSWEMNRILGSRNQVDVTETVERISEVNLMTQDSEDAVEKNLLTNKQVDQQATETLVGAKEHHSHLATSDEPICDNEESEEPKEFPPINHEYIVCEIHNDEFDVPAEKVMLVDAAASRGSDITDLDKFDAEYSRDLIKADNIAVDAGVPNCSGPRGFAIDMVPKEAPRKVDMLKEAEHLGTSLPAAPEELYADYENVKETSEEKHEDQAPSKDYSRSAERKEIFDEGRGNSYTDVALRFEEVNEAITGKCSTIDGFKVEKNTRYRQEVLKEKFDEPEHAAIESTSYGNRGTRHAVKTEEADSLYRLDDEVVTAGDSEEAVNSENLNVASMLIPEIAFDCSAVSPLSASSNHETAGDVWRLELDLLSAQKKSPATKMEGSVMFDKMLNSSTTKQNYRSALIQKPPKLLVHDMKENVLSTKRGKTGNITKMC